MFEYVKVVSQLSISFKWNKESDDMESILTAREKGENIISYINFSKFCHVTKCVTDLKQTFGKEDITFPPSSSSKAIEFRKDNLSQLEQYVD